MYKWEVSQTNNGFKTAIFESYLETVFCKPAGNNAATFYFVLLKKTHICLLAFLSTDWMVLSEMQNFINACKWDYF